MTADDKASETEQFFNDLALKQHKPLDLSMKPGECNECGEWFAHLVQGVCCPCRFEAEKKEKCMIN